MIDGWRAWRPAIWLAMVGVAVALLMSTVYLGLLIIGGSVGVAVRINQRRRHVNRGVR